MFTVYGGQENARSVVKLLCTSVQKVDKEVKRTRTGPEKSGPRLRRSKFPAALVRVRVRVRVSARCSAV
eukprot:scaffold32994_cov72-Phaeocystis_antarctica.AAC.4